MTPQFSGTPCLPGAAGFSPIEIVGAGALAGLVASLAVSILARLLPGMRNPTRVDLQRKQGKRRTPEEAPVQPFTPEGALTRSESPGPEGAAELFAAKVGSGLFARNLRTAATFWGKVTHFAYGSAWGIVYGLVQASTAGIWWLSGVLSGVVVWAVGPAWLVPAMRIMPPPARLGLMRNLALIGAHLAYGLIIAAVFRVAERGRFP